VTPWGTFHTQLSNSPAVVDVLDRGDKNDTYRHPDRSVVFSTQVSVAALATAGFEIEIADSVETAKRNGRNEATLRRTLRMKSALLNAIPMYSFTGPAGE
jgi:hypothetical protein